MMNLKFLSLLIMSLFIISCLTDTENTEETAGKTVKIWDISNISNINLLGEYLGENGLAHNAHIKENLVYISHYTTGIKIIDIFNPLRPVEVASFDTYPINDDGGFYGCWGAYPFTSNDYIYASDMQNGLFVLNFENINAGWTYGNIYFNNSIPLQNATIESLLNNKIFHTDNEGYFDIGFPEGEHLFIINNQDTVSINFFAHQEQMENIYLGQELILGDINQDFNIDILDIIMIINIILNNFEPNSEQLWASNINNDTLINIQDIILLVQIILD